MEIALATSNAHKVRETGEILDSRGLKLVAPNKFVEVVEDGDTFEANASLKAVANSKLNNIYCVGEDSGLEVDALNGAPGVLSARFSDSDGESVSRAERDLRNNQKLLNLLKGETNRNARYVCAVALSNPQGEIIFTARGVCGLMVGDESRGKNGFGYDFICGPVEFPGRYYSELTSEEKNRISHRSKAWEKLIQFINTANL